MKVNFTIMNTIIWEITKVWNPKPTVNSINLNKNIVAFPILEMGQGQKTKIIMINQILKKKVMILSQTKHVTLMTILIMKKIEC